VSGAAWAVPADLPAFAGHFPGRPIVPGVLLLERALALIAAEAGVDPACGSIANAKFLSPVGPGETLDFSWQARPDGAWALSIRAGERLVASGVLSLAARA
jgi:3-hydroxymyristoyl/3-hydroxydecanoyl-(acyl carrier protein) dehydratase